jgi:hypothetical protein
MNLLYYTANANGVSERLRKAINSIVPVEQTQVYRSIEGLSRGLLQRPYDMKIAVFLTDSREELLEILAIRDLFHGIRIILVLPDRDGDTVSVGLKLYPRFFTYADGNFEDIAAVMKKMMESLDQG